MARSGLQLQDDDLLPIPEVETATGHARQTLVRWILEGRLPAISIAAGTRRRFLVRRSNVDALCNRRRSAAEHVEQPA